MIIITIIDSIVLMNFIYKKEALIYLNKKTLIACKENVFKKFIHKKINVIITFIKEIFHKY